MSNVDIERLRAVVDEVAHSRLDGELPAVLSIVNNRRRAVISGPYEQLERVQQRCNAIAEHEAAQRALRQHGGSLFAPRFDPLEIQAAFHHPALDGAVDIARGWARQCGLDSDRVAELTRLTGVDPVNWPDHVAEVVQSGAEWILDIGPGHAITRLSYPLVAGSGIGMIAVSSREGQRELLTAGAAPVRPAPWSSFSPRVRRLPSGQLVAETSFTRLTGRSPMLLAGMTPTTVDPAIVAAAANAGHWAELAGGGQVTEQLLTERLDSLADLLEPGRTAQFNAMFLDARLWKLHVSGKRLVPRARAAGAPIDGIVVTAGILERDDAVALIEELHTAGISFVAFKPGTVAQIDAVIAIAERVPDHHVIAHIEGGRAGGHHSWEDLDDLLIATYARLRTRANLVVCVGGGIGTPERAAEYLTGSWSRALGYPAMPTDGILVGTAAMATLEATTTEDVKRLLVATGGTDRWIGAGTASAGMASGRSQLGADIHEIDNAASRCGRLLDQVAGDADAVAARHGEVVAALNATAKPYFGDVSVMTYEQWLRRYLELSYDDSWIDAAWESRFVSMIERTEARLDTVDSGPIATITVDAAADPLQLLDDVLELHPAARSTLLHPGDAPYFLGLCRTPGKPVGFVPVVDAEVRRWWRSDSLWQAHDPRYSADQVCVIPGPVAVGGIDRMNEPVGELLDRFESAAVRALLDEGGVPTGTTSRRGGTAGNIGVVLDAPDVMWAGRLIDNPILRLGPAREWVMESPRTAVHTRSGSMLVGEMDSVVTLSVPVSTGRDVEIGITVAPSTADGAVPQVDPIAATDAMLSLLDIAAGVSLPAVRDGVARSTVAWVPAMVQDHAAVTADGLPAELYQNGSTVPDVIVGACWPAVYAVLGEARTADRASAIEGFLDLVHLDHHIERVSELPTVMSALLIRAEVRRVDETDIGRVVQIEVQVDSTGARDLDPAPLAVLTERFVMRGRLGAGSATDPVVAGAGRTVVPTARKRRRDALIVAPLRLEAFASMSGDHNPIHTSDNAAALAGLGGPIVHGMWMSAAAQQVVQAASATGDGPPNRVLREWTARFLAPIRPGVQVAVSVDRVGICAGAEVLEISCRVDGQLVMTASALGLAPVTAFAFPGQGIQRPGMGLDAMARSEQAREVWSRADEITRRTLDFSILAVVRDNPTEIRLGTQVFAHPDGVLYLTQFTQVAMAVMSFAQFAELRASQAVAADGMFAGHSVGEYNALAALGVLDLDTVVELVFRRGSIMSNLTPRGEDGRSEYRMAVIRPNRMGISHADVKPLVDRLSRESGAFVEVVNYNLRDAQYAVAGSTAGLDALQRYANARGERAFVQIPGIDIPFHSSVLRSGVSTFRRILAKLVPREIDPSLLLGRYIPNLVARPMELDRYFLESIAQTVPSESAAEMLENFDAWSAAPARMASEVLIELLAWQFASPVRWIETQELLLRNTAAGGMGVERFVEVGLGSAPTVANLAAATLSGLTESTRRADRIGYPVEILNVERDRAAVFGLDTDAPNTDTPRTDDAVNQAAPAAATAPALTAPAPTAHIPTAPAGGSRPADLTFTASAAARVLISLWTKIDRSQIVPTDSVESLCDGVSSRRNQLLLDLGSELGTGPLDGVADTAVSELLPTLERQASGYKPFGPVLSDAIEDQLRKVFGPSGRRAVAIGERVANVWQLGPGWVAHVRAEVAMATRDGSSVRGGAFSDFGGTLADAAAVDSAIDACVSRVAAAQNVSVALPSVGTASDSVVDSGELLKLAEQITGPDGILAYTARTMLARLNPVTTAAQAVSVPDTTLLDLVSAELGADWPRLMAPVFDARRAVLLDDRWACAREDLVRIWMGDIEPVPERFLGAGKAVAQQARWWSTRAADEDRDDLAARYVEIVDSALSAPSSVWGSEVAVVTGASPGSIAAAIVADLLSGGATVIATTSSLGQERLGFFETLYRTYGSIESALWVVPANLACYSDVDALADWIGSVQRETAGGKTRVVKRPLVPTLLLPFAAPRVGGSLTDVGGRAELEMRVLLWSVERLVATMSTIGADIDTASRLHVVLPGSPNRGLFGGDGAYGEAKAALDALTARWNAEQDWAYRVTLVHALIGWVMGTGLMGHNDRLAAAANAAGVQTWTTGEMAEQILAQCTPDVRAEAAKSPVRVDLSGGLGDAGLDFAELARTVVTATPAAAPTERTVDSLPTPPHRAQAAHLDWPELQQNPADLIVIVGAGEVGTYGSSRTRFEMEVDARLSAAGVVELAWNTGLIEWRRDPAPGWYDTESSDLVPEAEIAERYHDAVVARCGIREFGDYMSMTDHQVPLLTSVYLENDLSFVVSSEAEARSFQSADAARTLVEPIAGGADWRVTRLAGTEIRVPRKMTLTRTVGAHLPEGFDATRWGVPADMVASLDPVAVWNLVATVDAFVSSGFTPAELLRWVHPRYVANTQGTGQGAQQSMASVYVDTLLGDNAANDILQETLPNVIAAHTVQSYVGGYGAMVNPSAACATAAVSVEEGVDKIRLGKATLVVTGGFDDAGPQSINGFANMSATADSAALEARGIDPRHFSRPNDRRRAGFVEGQGGGTILLARGDLALKMGLPVLGVVAWAGTFGDGIHTSIPAPGLGALGAGLGGVESELAVALRDLGVPPDDVAVVSKHDTSTRANDPNEAELHERLGTEIGRSPGAPLFVVSQKSLVGHSKGGAAALQLIGLCQVLAAGTVPANRSLDCVDGEMAVHERLVWPRAALELTQSFPLRAGLLTSLGFGHVSGMIAVVNAAAFLAAVPEDERESYLDRCADRRVTGDRTRLAALYGGPAMYQRPADRRLGDHDAHELESRMLVSPEARLGEDGTYRTN
ncbi:DUF1729 domain-containing protein [Rhodococcus sp. IEGM 1401]|uniref:type I polyketide synthase n=1 Tax=unclassified Rhodococcus (in: high G+C Gram-positive bacteria) TaxID=192944 RepID=UPI0022B58BEE|nr:MULTISPECIES: type I polyketide synthase [unclassified Rhodococcus (in: high G+C Gram-positive bacteria)]MCZ4560876.1 DUF1729 domain-containing protein [Rhodococcus sp. IEGM 1401]MDI9921017.1 DUF1729 domain-containing protein [Rhodococcus sp. IEGM 1372]MDV8033383.1 type I polyketide synthase [Rhodococcus sp. IEGM 1414]